MLTTVRLVIIPLTYQQLAAYIQASDVLEEELGLVKGQRVMDEGFRQMIEAFSLPSMKKGSPGNHIFYTCWIIVDRPSNKIVAELGFKGPPNTRGEIEIGYGTQADERGKGYMTEAVGSLLDWAAKQPAVHTMLAETDESNQASIRVMQKNGFEQFSRRGIMLWWRKVLKPDAEKSK